MEIPQGYVPLTRSKRSPAPGARLAGPADPAEMLAVSIRARRSPGAPPFPDPSGSAPDSEIRCAPWSREEMAERYGADQADLDQVAAFAQSHGLSVLESSRARRTVRAQGTVEQMSRAFAVDLGYYESGEERYRGREGFVHIPGELEGIVEGVFGLDNRRMARPLFVRADAAAQAAAPNQAVSPLTPPQVATLYDFPAGSAAGQTIGVLEFGGGYTPADIEAFFSGLHLTTPALASVGVDGQQNSPGSDFDSDVEVALDIDVAGSVAQGTKIVAYFAPWTEAGWVDVVTTAVYDTVNRPSALSISWGWPELETADGFTWSSQAMDAVNQTFQEAAAMGVTVLAASGDHGSGCDIGDGKPHVLYPAVDPCVTGCGGTTIENVAGTSFTEITWNDNGITGGGVSVFWPLPDWQSKAGVPHSLNNGFAGRGVPDIAGNADSNSGYELVVGGVSTGPVGGTSAVAPLYAGLIARMNAQSGELAGYLNPDLYSPQLQQGYVRGVFRNIDDGRSNASGGAPGYTAGPGWNACTGWGSVNGTALMVALPRLATGQLWHTIRLANGAWSGLGWVNGEFGIPGPVTAVSATWDGTPDETQFMFTTFTLTPGPPPTVTEWGLWHTMRLANGSWTGLGNVLGQFPVPGPVHAVSAGWSGLPGETEFLFATDDGHLWHSIREPSGTWTGLGDVQGEFQIPAPVRAVSAANDGNPGEAQFMFST